MIAFGMQAAARPAGVHMKCNRNINNARTFIRGGCGNFTNGIRKC
jgi:hypothetical protein